MPRGYGEANCFGYALRKNKWLWVRSWFYSKEHKCKETMVNEIIRRYKLKLVNREDMVKGKEYVAFRWSKGDFHFARRSKTGQWSHKAGSRRPETMSTKEVFGDCWVRCDGHRYDSELVLFEV